MHLRPIGPDNLDQAQWLLRRGFPERSAAYWQGVLDRLEAFRARALIGPVGVLLSLKDEPAGVLLTIGSRTPGAPAATKVNLSSWYVEERARFLAPRMLQQVTAASDVLYTDLSPSKSVRALNERLGLMPVRVGSIIAPTALDAVRRDDARVIDHSVGESSSEAPMLADHAGLGAVSALLDTGSGMEALIFVPTRLRGLRGMRLLFAPSLASVARHRGAIARYLLRQGAWFLEVEADAGVRWPATLFAANRSAVFAKGAFRRDQIDHSYSELLFLSSAT